MKGGLSTLPGSGRKDAGDQRVSVSCVGANLVGVKISLNAVLRCYLVYTRLEATAKW